MKYCGISTPFKGVRIYTRSAMGMPGSETVLEELMSRVLGDLIQEGVVAKVADDLYCGGDTPEELLINWRKVLCSLQKNSLALSAKKTSVAPKSTTILGWTWTQGELHASPHRISTLSSCARPENVKSLRSYLGAYKFLSCVIPSCSSYLAPLESLVGGKASKDPILWSSESEEAFFVSQKHLHDHRSITIPKPSDQLWVVTDGAVKSPGLGSTLYVQRDGTTQIAGYFSAKLKDRQILWIPCEMEALSIAVSLQHFSPYIIASHHKTCVLTDSKPCVQAYNRLCKGHFSHSSRVTTFLSTASRYSVQLQHLNGSVNVPSDFACRNPPECFNTACQICFFVNDLQTATVQKIDIRDITSGTSKMPFVNRPAWLSLQSDCADLRRCHAHLKQGTRPSKKVTNIRDVKRYLQHCTISKDGLLVVPHRDPFSQARERIVVPRRVLDGLLTALHIKLVHPTQFQLKQVFTQYFFALDLDSTLRHLNDNCHICISTKKMNYIKPPASTSNSPPTIGLSFAADVMRRERQFVLVLRETVTSDTKACFIENEDHSSLRDGIIQLSVGMIPLDGPSAIIRTDPAPGFRKLVGDQMLANLRLSIELGLIKNVNKNPVAEKAVQELEDELLKLDRDRSTLSKAHLAVALAHLNTRLRFCGLSARELWTQRDQFTSEQLPMNDRELIDSQHHRCLAHNALNNQRLNLQNSPQSTILEGTIVYIKSERNKTMSRPRYLVTLQDGPWYHLKKFTGNQLRNVTYKVHRDQLCHIPVSPTPRTDSLSREEPSVDDEDPTLDPTTADCNAAIETSSQVNQPTVPAQTTPSLDAPISTLPSDVTPPPPVTPPTVLTNPPSSDQHMSTYPPMPCPQRKRQMPARFQDYDMT